jgi:transposase
MQNTDPVVLSELVRWFKTRTANAQGSRKPMIVAPARKLIIAL